MGQPKRQRRKYERPRKPYDRDRLARERKIVSEFGLKRKIELWKIESLLRDYRRRARELLAKPDDKKQAELFEKLNKQGFSCSKLEDVLSINAENMLSRRLQTIVYKRGFATTPKHARQLIVHRHILIDGRKVAWPSYIVPVSMEDKIELDPKLKREVV